MPASVALKVHDALTQLEVDGHAPVEPLAWLVESCRDGKPFWQGLMSHHATTQPTPPKSVLLESYDFYGDIVLRSPREKQAFRWWDDEEKRWESFTYGELDMLVGRRAKEWEGRGVSSGQTVALFLPMGPDFVVSLFAALRLGAIVTVIPPTGLLAIKKRVESAAPDHIATDPDFVRLLGDAKEKAIPADLPPATESLETSGVYSSNSPWAKLFSPFGKPFEALPVTADAGYLWSLRDGVLAFGIKPGDLLLAAGVPLVPAQPSLLIATLLAGGIYCHLELEQVKKQPALLDSNFKHVVVTRELREVVIGAKTKVGKSWKSWSRLVDEGGDAQRWWTFVTSAGLESSFASNVHIDAASGGCPFFSMKRRTPKGGFNSFVLPSAGVEWFLAAASGKGRSLTLGRFTFKKPGEEEPAPGSMFSRRDRGELLFIGLQSPHRGGRTYPVEEVLASIEPLPFVLESAIVPVPTGDLETPYQLTLAVFCGEELRREMGEQRADWRELIEQSITRDLGPEWLPDLIEFFPLYARRKEGLTDPAWVTQAYLMGSLHTRSREEPYTLITRLRSLVLGWEPPKAIPPPPAEGDAPPPEEPPPESPPAEEPPPESPPAEEPPPSDAPPPEGEAPPPEGEAPPSDAPPPEGEAPPSDAPPPEGEAPPSDAPSDTPSETPSETPAEATATASDTPPSDSPPTETVSETPPTGQEERAADETAAPNPTSDVMLIVDDEPGTDGATETPSEPPPDGGSPTPSE